MLTEQEKAASLAACPDEYWRTLVFVALTTGCRRSELLDLTWCRVDFDNARLIIMGTKSKKDRMQPLPVEAVGMLRKLQESTIEGWRALR